mmetsp:Transcript_8283/g.13856  ORF Transcript_8283/g.13856 Transcript_8283/m.13856 type:complete len:109 (+) Transcript_8283:392-718(+)
MEFPPTIDLQKAITESGAFYKSYVNKSWSKLGYGFLLSVLSLSFELSFPFLVGNLVRILYLITMKDDDQGEFSEQLENLLHQAIGLSLVSTAFEWLRMGVFQTQGGRI